MLTILTIIIVLIDCLIGFFFLKGAEVTGRSGPAFIVLIWIMNLLLFALPLIIQESSKAKQSFKNSSDIVFSKLNQRVYLKYLIIISISALFTGLFWPMPGQGI